MNKKKLRKVRRKIDFVDNKLLKLIKKRTILVNQVIKIKNNKRQIVDNKRINKILKNIKRKSLKIKIDPKITNQIWSSMIKSYISYERRNFKKK
tara:strand:+ start:352 stop:633 length:282 start_codon:yes stop_codon:yes gene_type:complete